MSDLAARSAIEIDRLVLGVNRQVGPRHGEWLMKVARDLGLDSLELIPHLGEFWLQVPVPVELAVCGAWSRPDWPRKGRSRQLGAGFERRSKTRRTKEREQAGRSSTRAIIATSWIC